MKHEHVLCLYPHKKNVSFVDFPPIGLEYIASVMQEHADTVDLVDMRHEKNPHSFIKDTTSIIAVSIYWGWERETVCSTVNSLPGDILTVAGGPEVTENVLEYFELCPTLDIIVRGDGEEIMRDIGSGKPLESIKGISYRKNGHITHNENRGLSLVEDELYPARTSRRTRYRFSFRNIYLGHDMDLLSTSRGCPFNCRFCNNNKNPYGTKRRWSPRSPEAVIHEIKQIDSDIIFLTDQNFCFDPDRVAEMCDLVKKHNIHKKFLFQTRIDIAKRPDVLQKMQDTGFCWLCFGLESPHDTFLKQLNKGITKQDICDAFEVFKHFKKMIYQGFYIIGNIGETEQEMREIVSFSRHIGLDMAVPFILQNRKFTEIESIVNDEPNYHICKKTNYVYSDNYSVEYLKKIQGSIYRKFYNPYHCAKLLRKFKNIGFINSRACKSITTHAITSLTSTLLGRNNSSLKPSRNGYRNALK